LGTKGRKVGFLERVISVCSSAPLQLAIVELPQSLIQPIVEVLVISGLKLTSSLASKNTPICFRLMPSAACILMINSQRARFAPPGSSCMS
jgi:hypothetical protein